MNHIHNFDDLIRIAGPGIYVLMGIIAIVGIAAQWMLYQKCKQPGIACVVPVWNIIVFLKIIGRPTGHSLWVMIPPPIIIALLYIPAAPGILELVIAGVLAVAWMYLMVNIYIELCHCFGKKGAMNYALMIALNGAYVLYLGLSDDKYLGAEKGYQGTQSDSSSVAEA